MERELIILTTYLNPGENPIAKYMDEAKRSIDKFCEKMPPDIKDKYHIVMLCIPTKKETHVKCVFPKKPDKNVMSKIEKLIDEQNKTHTWLQQHLTKE